MRCIEYKGYIGNSGYGLDYDPETQKTILAHRLAFKLSYGYLPKVVMHSCDNPRCVNPEHLVGGTQSENAKDAVKKGRWRKPKLTVEQMLEIQKSPLSTRKLGTLYGVNQKTICNIRKYDITGKGGTCGS